MKVESLNTGARYEVDVARLAMQGPMAEGQGVTGLSQWCAARASCGFVHTLQAVGRLI